MYLLQWKKTMKYREWQLATNEVLKSIVAQEICNAINNSTRILYRTSIKKTGNMVLQVQQVQNLMW